MNVIGGGCANSVVNGNCNVIGGGFANNVGCSNSTVGGGYGNCACAPCSTVAGGCNNKVLGNGQLGAIGGGQSNCIVCAGAHNFIGGGCNNLICNSVACSGILGGASNILCHSCSFIIGKSITSTASCYTYVNNLCSFGAITSDARLKENITSLPYGLCEIKQLEPVKYAFKNDESKAFKYGFLAQCVQQIMPNLITTHPTDLVDGEPVLQFDKEAIWGSLVNAIKEQQIQIDELRAEIELLKNT
jgi:hypothetical protein